MTKLTQITSEQVFDMLPYAVDIFDKLDIQNVGIEIAKKNKTKEPNKKQKEVGIAVIMHIIKNSGKVKDEFFNIVAIVEGISFEDAKSQGIMKTIATIKTVFDDADIMGFFQQSMKSE